MSDWRLSRRTFLKATSALGAAAAVSGTRVALLREASTVAEAQAAGSEVKIIPTFCQGCGSGKTNCSLLAHVVDGKWVRTEGNPDAGNNGRLGTTSLCAKGNAAAQYLYSPKRLTYPMKRVGEKGEGKLERITWDEALKTVADKLLELKDKYGAECYAQLVPEHGPACKTFGNRLLNVYGSPNFCHSALCAMQRIATNIVTLGIGGTSATSPGQLDKTKLLVVWGANAENTAVNSTGEPVARINAIEQGLKVIDIRPMLNELGAKADIWLPVRPGTDCALALAILNVIIGEKLYDLEFVSNWCNGFNKLAEHVKQYPPEWAAPITGISAEKITEVARLMGTTKPMAITIGNGVGDQQNDGNAAVWAIDLICAITGNIDIPGGAAAAWSVGPSLIKLNGVTALPERATPDMVDKLVAPEFPRWYQQPGSTTSAYYKALMSILTGEPYPVRAVLAANTNPLSAARNTKKVAEALKQLEFFFVIDAYWTPAVDYADIVLPACTGYECSHQIGTKNHVEGTWMGIYNKIAEPLGESRSDWQIFLDLGVAMGYGEDFWNGDMEACLREQLEPSGFTLEELREAPTGIFVPRTDPRPPEPTYKNYDQLFKNLPNGKVQCYSERIGGKPTADETGTLPYLPIYQGPPEGIAQTPELAEEYPLIFSDVHGFRLCEHSYLVDSPYLREKQPYPWVRINPATAKKYGIGDGEWMKVESPHGWIKMVAEYFEGIAPDVLMSRRGWWQACDELGLEGYGYLDGGSETNNLYNGDETLGDKFHSGMAKQTLVKISKL
jgi:thiosulfate reductase/polysulfide reductase chain A